MTLVRSQTDDAPKQVEHPTTVDSKESKESDNMFDHVTETTPVEVNKETSDKAKLPGVAHPEKMRVSINQEEYTKEDLEITPQEKSNFVNALITGERYTQQFELFGGRAKVVLRSRTNRETQALYTFIRHALAIDNAEVVDIQGDMSQVLLVAHVAELNGVSFPAMEEPLTYTEVGGASIPPGWLKALAAWKSKPEALTSAILNRIQLFEYKYWTMTMEANNKNFWNSDTSTEK